MQREEIEHVLRAAAAISRENSFVLVGSQAVALLLDAPPAELLVSTEIDLYPSLHPEKSGLIDGAIGALSTFHDTFGYHADGVGPETAVLPPDWMQRAQFFYFGEVTAICPDLHDLAASKCVAFRDKDADFVRVLLHHGLIQLSTLLERIALLNLAEPVARKTIEWAQRRASEATA
ncbi:MAG: hypothetical protein KF796_05435 [Ramlibacter sp.]|nr:hypothetical protein [Ramlibacter sp.]